MNLSFERFAEDLAAGLSADGPVDAERSLLVEEVKIGCTLGMLQCLDRPHRLAYVLGEILEMAVLSFTRSYCGLASDTAACACNRRVPTALRAGRIRADGFDFARTASSFQEARAIVRRVDEARWALEVHRTSHPRESSVEFALSFAKTASVSTGERSRSRL